MRSVSTVVVRIARRLPRRFLGKVARVAQTICSLVPYRPATIPIYEDCSHGVEVRASLIPDAGNGLFATKPFGAREPICPYLGSKLSLFQWLRTPDWRYCLGVNPTIDAGHHPKVMARYVNHHFDATKVNCTYEELEGRGRWVVATRAIQTGEELYADYGVFYWAFFERP